MTKSVTIDNYDLKAHQRYANDREALDPFYITDTNLIPPHFEIAALESSINSKWEELFETHLHRHSFANFAPPPSYALMRNRFFSYVISPDFNWLDQQDKEDEGSEPKQKQDLAEADVYKQKIKEKNSRIMPIALFEKERTTLLNLIDSIQLLNGFLRDVNARKLQYQKG